VIDKLLATNVFNEQLLTILPYSYSSPKVGVGIGRVYWVGI
jgi:hypothetical protein